MTAEQLSRLPEEERDQMLRLHAAEMATPSPLDVPCPECSFMRHLLSPAESAALTAEQLVAAGGSDETRPDLAAVPVNVMIRALRMPW
jgi:hypothetical protein